MSAACAAGLLAGSKAVVADRPKLEMLGRISHGRWELRLRDGTVLQLCIADKAQLIQLRHPDSQCSRIVLEDEVSSVTVQYTCRGRGYGRTHIRRETANLIQVETQGIADGLPFEFSAEGRRIGECAP